MFKSVIVAFACVSAVLALGDCKGPCASDQVCCHSDNISYNGKCYNNATQTCCQTWAAPNICNITTQHCINDNQGCHPGPAIPPVCTKSSLGECKSDQACCYATHGSNPLPDDIPPPKCFSPLINEACCISQVNQYQTPKVNVCNSTQTCDHKSGCKNM